MSKTRKDRKDQSKSTKRQGKGGDKEDKKTPVVAKEKKVRVRGVKPDYSPKKEISAILDKSTHHCTDTHQLLNGIPDKDKYLIGDIELAKDMFPRYKGSSDEELVIVAENVPPSHRLALAGCGSGTRIPYTKVMNPVFVCNIKNDDVRKAIFALWKFLRNEASLPIEDYTTPVVHATKIEVAEEVAPAFVQKIEGDHSMVLKNLWNADRMDLHGGCLVVEIKGATFEIKEVETRYGVGNGIFLKSAAYDCPLFEQELSEENSRVYLIAEKLRHDVFQTKLLGNGAKHQEAVWKFLRSAKAEADLIIPKKLEVLKPEPTKVEQQPMSAKVVSAGAPSIRPLKDMVEEAPGYYDLRDGEEKLVVMMAKAQGVRQLKVIEIDKGHKLFQFGIRSSYSIPVQLVVNGASESDTQATKEFVQYIRTLLVGKGVVKSFKGGDNHQEKETKHHHSVRSQFGKKVPHVRLAARNGQQVGKGTDEPKALEKGFLASPIGLWKTEGDVVFRCGFMGEDILLKVVSDPKKVASGYTKFVVVRHLAEDEYGYPGHELRNHIRSCLRKVGELPVVGQQVKQA